MSEELPKSESDQQLQRFHIRFGWWSLLLFLVLGAALELFIGFQMASYVAAENDTRRLMWRLAHVHGTLLSFIHLAYGLTLILVAEPALRSKLTSNCLLGASILLPIGFFLAGIQIFDGDPGWPIFVVPIGALMLLVAVFKIALAFRRSG